MCVCVYVCVCEVCVCACVCVCHLHCADQSCSASSHHELTNVTDRMVSHVTLSIILFTE